MSQKPIMAMLIQKQKKKGLAHYFTKYHMGKFLCIKKYQLT